MNRLAAEASPYLRQHAANPVDWYPWGEEAFDRARREDRPIFLSIGYSSCHWCHVMAHESFEDSEVAAALGRDFVSIKVDREERPDVDAVYMDAVQALTGSGGWPMSVFLTPDGRPFYAGTYFPPTARGGLPSFRDVLTALADAWGDRRPEVERQADDLAAAVSTGATRLTRAAVGPAGGAAPAVAGQVLAAAAGELESRLDDRWGGFGGAPKFPQPALVDLLLRSAATTADEAAGRALRAARRTLDGMAAGGIHDHLGGGFSRYSTDVRWHVPHFEKMLYDQAGLLLVYLHAWQVTGEVAYRQVVEGIASYVARDLTTPGGGVCSAEDADSEGEEGRFYVWTPEEVTRAVSGGTPDPEERDRVAAAVEEFFGMSAGPNFEGRSILFRPIGAPLRGPGEVEAGRRLLFEARTRRPRPGLDDKVLTEWNAMYASALAEAAAAADRSDWASAAVRTGEFLLENLRTGDGRWLRSWQAEHGPRHLAYAGDYAWLVDCFTRLGELTGEARWTAEARTAADGLVRLFHDDAGGGFFTTGHDAETLIVRPKEVLDGAVPSANGAAAVALVRLAALTGVPDYAALAAEIVELVRPLLDRHPTAVAQAVVAAELLAAGPTEVVVPGRHPELLATVRARWRPSVVVAWGEPTGSPLWDERQAGLAYVCRYGRCELPAADPETLSRQLATAEAA